LRQQWRQADKAKKDEDASFHIRIFIPGDVLF
jgi:hypothetical protein